MEGAAGDRSRRRVHPRGYRPHPDRPCLPASAHTRSRGRGERRRGRDPGPRRAPCAPRATDAAHLRAAAHAHTRGRPAHPPRDRHGRDPARRRRRDGHSGARRCGKLHVLGCAVPRVRRAMPLVGRERVGRGWQRCDRCPRDRARTWRRGSRDRRRRRDADAGRSQHRRRVRDSCDLGRRQRQLHGKSELQHEGDGWRETDTHFPPTDFAAVAVAKGARGRRVTREEHLDEALREAIEAEGPFVVDVVVDRKVRRPIDARTRTL